VAGTAEENHVEIELVRRGHGRWHEQPLAGAAGVVWIEDNIVVRMTGCQAGVLVDWC
jgi:hypothetical protein